MSLPLYLSDGFWDTFFPNATQRTRDSYQVYLGTLDPENDNIVDWVENVHADNAKLEKLRLLRIINEYIPDYEFISEWIDETSNQLKIDKFNGKNQTQRGEQENQMSVEVISKLIAKGTMTTFNLFGLWLPPRRREIRQFKITDDYVENVNQYCKSKQCFYFHHFKNDTNKDTQTYTWNDLSFLENSSKIKQYLHSLPVGLLFGNLYTPNHFSRKYKEENGHNINAMRHAWSTIGRRSFDRLGFIQLTNWMDHSISMSVRTYSS